MNPVWLVTGAAGMLGQDLMAALAHEDVTAVAADRTALDIADPGSVREAFAAHRPAVVVNCAAWTAVDDAESQEAAALRVNGTGPAVLAAACREHGTVLLHVSTDYVFAGDSARPYGEDDPTAPRTAYGRTKLAGERAVLETLPGTGYVVRTAWLYGAGGANFVRTMIRLEGVKDTLDVVDDQRGQPTWTVDLVEQARPARTGRARRHRPGGRLPRHQRRRDDLVRFHPGDLPAARRGPGPGPPDHQRGLRETGPPARVQRARARAVCRGRDRTRPGLAHGTGGGVPGAARRGTPPGTCPALIRWTGPDQCPAGASGRRAAGGPAARSRA